MNDEDSPSASPDSTPSAAPPDHPSPSIDPSSEPHTTEEQCDAVLKDAALDEEMAGDYGGDVVTGESAGLGGMEAEGKEAAEELDSLMDEADDEAAVEKDGIGQVESESVRVLESERSGENRGETQGNDDGQQNVNVQEVTLSVERIRGDVVDEIETEREEEGTGDEETPPEAFPLPETAERGVEKSGDSEENVGAKQEDELKGEVETEIGGSSELPNENKMSGEGLLREDVDGEEIPEEGKEADIGGEELPDLGMDDDTQRLNDNAISKREEGPDQIEEIDGCLLIGDSKPVVEGEELQDDGMDAKNQGLTETDNALSKAKEDPDLINESAGSPLIGDNKEVKGEELHEDGMEAYHQGLNENALSKGAEDLDQMDDTAVSPLVGGSKEVYGKELLVGGVDDHDLGLSDNAGFKREQDTDKKTEIVGSPLIGDNKVDGEGLFEDVDDFGLNGNTEPQEDHKLVQPDEIAEAQLVDDEGKDIGGDEETQDIDDIQSLASQDEVGGEDEVAVGSTEMEIEGETDAGSGKSVSGGKRKRGRTPKVPGKTPKVLVGEDVCFICLDGGDLVLCDRRGCSKAYHPSCVDHDEAFFRAKGRWNCGWHLCSKCEKNAYYMCCTCAFSLCKGCIKDAVIFCIRGNKGLCETCMKTVMLIENIEEGNDDMDAFDDKSQWEYLFKDYWIEQKEKLCFTAEEIAQAKNPWKGLDIDSKQGAEAGNIEGSEAGNASDSSLADAEATTSKRKKLKKRMRLDKKVGSDTDSSLEKPGGSSTKRKAKRRLKTPVKETGSDSDNSTGNRERANNRGKKSKKLAKSHANGGTSLQLAGGRNSSHGNTEWASEELLEFVSLMKNGDRSAISQFDVQALLLEYIKQNKLRDPRRRSQIVCDPMLQKLFGKPRVGHFEMLKLLESHFLIKDDYQADDNQGSVVDTEASQMDVDETAIALRGRKSRKKGGDKGLQSNLDDYAAIDMHNISLIYLRRNLMEALLEDSERFQEKVVGSFVRIRIPGNLQKQELYRLVQVVGTNKAVEPYKVGKRTTDITLEILNLDKTELVSIDTISNQEFTEDECKRLRQSIKCGLISRLTVGDVLGKAKELHRVRVTDWLETETERLRHLCDRASDLGRKKELRENVEKLLRIKTPEERQRRLEEIPVVHADPNMDPSYESDDESEMENKRQEINVRQRDNGSFRRGSDQFSARKGGYSSNDLSSPSAISPHGKSDLSRNFSGDRLSGRKEDASHAGEATNRSSWHQGADRGTPQSNTWDKLRSSGNSTPGKYNEFEVRNNTSPPTVREPMHHSSPAISQVDAKINEAEKLWHYRDPSGKVQGPFSVVQLRKWNSSGFFPANLRIWKTTETKNDSILLTSALAGNFQKEPSVVSALGTSHLHGSALQHGSSDKGLTAPSSLVTSKFSTNVHDTTRKPDPSNLPSPTPSQSSIALTRRRDSRWSPAIVPNQSSSPVIEGGQLRGGNGVLPSTPMVGSEVSQFPGYSNPSSSQPSMGSIGSSHTLTNPQQVSSQSALQVATHPLPSNNTATSSMNAVQGVPNPIQTGASQNPSAYAQGSAHAGRPGMVNPGQTPGNTQAWGSAGPQNNQNMMQVQQQAYGYWSNALPVNGQPQPSGAGQFQGAGNFANQSFSGIPSQNQWMAQVPTNTAWGMAAPENAAWGSMPVNSNMGWVGQTPGLAVAAASSGQVAGQLPGPPAMAPTGSTNVSWQGNGNANTGWSAPAGNPGTWGSDQNRGGGASHQHKNTSGNPNAKGQGVCRFHENGHCKKGASCDYLHI